MATPSPASSNASCARPIPAGMDGRFAVRTGVPERLAAGLTAAGGEALRGDRRGAAAARRAAHLHRAERHARTGWSRAGWSMSAGFTPSDAAHVLGRQSNWDADRRPPRRRAFRPPARRPRPGRSRRRRKPSPSACSSRSPASRPRSSWKPPSPRTGSTARPPSRMRWSSAPSTPITASRGSPSRSTGPVIGLGASAPLHYAGLPPLVGNDCVVPADADVANALGAVVGQVRVSAEAMVSQPAEGIFRLSVGDDASARFRRRGSGARRGRGAHPRHRRRARACRRHRYGRDRRRARREGLDRRGPAHVHRSAGSSPSPAAGRGSRNEQLQQPRRSALPGADSGAGAGRSAGSPARPPASRDRRNRCRSRPAV